MKLSSLRTALRKTLLLSLLSLIAVPTLHSAEEKARDKWMNGYVTLEKAEDAVEQEKPVAAREFFRKARETFDLVHREYPTWNPSLLEYRINYCSDQIKQLDRKIAGENKKLSKPELISLTQSHTQTIGELEKENIELRQELSSTREALARARREAARKMTSQQNMADLMAENRKLRKGSEDMSGMIERKNEELAELRKEAGLKAVTERLQEELAQIKTTKANLENAYRIYQKAYENVKAKLKTATIEREQALVKNQSITKNFTEYMQKTEEQNQQIKTLHAEINRLEREMSAREAELKEAKSRLTEKTGENESLEKQLEQIDPLLDQLEQQKNKTLDLSDNLELISTENKDLMAVRNSLETEQARLENELDTARKKITALTAEYNKEKQSWQATHNKLKKEIRDGRLQLETMLAGRERLRERLRENQIQIAEMNVRMQEPPAENQKPEDKDIDTLRYSQLQDDLRETQAALKLMSDKARKLETSLEEKTESAEAAHEELDRIASRLAARNSEMDEARAEWNLEKQSLEKENKDALAQTTAQKKKLSDSENKIQQQQRKILDQQQSIAALQATEKRLVTKEGELANCKDSLKELQEKFLDQDLRYKKQQTLESDMTREINQLRGMLETLRAKNRSIQSDSEEFQKRRQAEKEERIELRKLLDASESRTEELLAEREKMKSQGRLRLEMLQEQEDQIATLEEKLNAAENELRDKTKSVKELERKKALSEDKLAVVDGLTASMSDIEKELNATREKLADALNEKDRLNVQIDDLSRSLKNKNSRIEAYRKAIEEERTSHGKSEDTLTAQLKKLNSQLDRERRARQDLQDLLSQKETADPSKEVDSPARISPPGEQKLRRRDEKFVIRGFLHQAAAAEEEGNVETAIWNYEKVLEKDPAREPALRRMGIIAAENGNDRDAVRYLKRAFRENPDNLDTLRTLGFTLIRRSQADLAISALSRAAAIDPENPEVHRRLGVACSMLGWKDAAEVQFMRTYELDEKDSGNAFNLAILLASLDPPRMQEAKEWYLKAKKLGNPGDPGLDEFFNLEKQKSQTAK